MRFDQTRTMPCVVPEVPGADPRCSISDFALSHPDMCGNGPVLILKPAVIMLCELGSVQFKAFEYANGVESELTDADFTSSDPDIFSVGVNSGSGTALAAGTVIVTVEHEGRTATATIQVRSGTNCCDDTHVVTGIVIDNSYSGTLNFGGAYASRLIFAKAIASIYGGTIREIDDTPKDAMRVWSLNSALTSMLDDFSNDTTEITDAIADITQSANKTDLLPAFVEVVTALLAETADQRILLLLSDGEHSANTDRQAILDAAATFKQAGGVIIVVGLRASGLGYDLLERVATGGYFINALPDDIDGAIESLAYLKSLLCAGACVPAGDEYVNTPELNYSSFNEFEVISGLVNLLGPGLLDLQPGNGLYVEMNGGVPATIRTIDSFPLLAGHTYLMKFRAAGNQREVLTGAALKVYLREAGALDTDPNLFEQVAATPYDQNFQDYTFAFTAPFDTTAKLYFQQLYSGSAPVIGSLLDAIRVVDQTNLETIFADDFDEENPVYVAPDCGPSAAREEVPDPDAPTASVLQDTGDPLLGGDESHRYAVSGVTDEGETVATFQITGLPVVTTDTGVVSVQIQPWPAEHVARIVRVRLWRTAASPSSPQYLLAELDVAQTHYLDYERNDEFAARLDNTVQAPQANTTAVAVGGLGYGYAECCYYSSEDVDLPEIANPDAPTTSIDSSSGSELVGAGFTNGSLIPLMTSNTTPSGVASANLEYVAAYRAFDGGVLGWKPWNLPDTSASHWLRYDFPYATKVDSFQLAYGFTHSLVTGYTRVFQGSNDGSSWTTLHTIHMVAPFAQVYASVTLSSQAEYLCYRVQWTRDDGTYFQPTNTKLELDGPIYEEAHETYRYAISDVTAEGETAAGIQVTGLTEAENEDDIVGILFPPASSPRITSRRVWRTLGALAGEDPLAQDLYLLAVIPANQNTYSDSERKSEFLARYDIAVTALTVNTTADEDSTAATFTNNCQPCATETPGEQLPDSNPLPDIESGTYKPPTSYTSTKNVCATCPGGSVNLNEALVPQMTGPSAPSGVASASSSADANVVPAWKAFDRDETTTWQANTASPLPQWLQYQFAVAKAVKYYSVQIFTAIAAPAAWQFQGSNDGSSWTTLDTRSDVSWYFQENKFFEITAPQSFLYYRLYLTELVDSTGQGFADPRFILLEFQMYSSSVASVCKTATETSTTSQLDADQKASATALALAQAALSCVARYTASIPYTAKCTTGFGADVTRVGNATSFISQEDADAQASAAAQAAAEAELDCEGSNNTQYLTINDRFGDEPAKASPYPSVKFVSGVPTTCTKVTVILKRFNHGDYGDVAIVLVGPTGKACYLMGNCMETASFDTTERNFTIDDDAASSFPAASRPAGVDHVFKPTIYVGQIAPFPAPCPAPDPGPFYATTLAEFIGENPNGAWALYVIDDTSQDVGYFLNGWDLTITP